MRWKLSFAVFFLAAVITSPASAQAPMGTIDRMFSDVLAAKIMCRISMEIEILKTKMGDKEASQGEKCIAEQKQEIVASYKAAIAKLGKKSEALKSAKQYHVFALTMLDGIRPLGGELTIQYKSRQNANDVRLAELENLVRVDAR